LLAICQVTKEFSKEHKYNVGESLNKKIELFTLIYRANTKLQKADVLQMARDKKIYSFADMCNERYEANKS
jgi:hypothetical protein